MKTAILLLVIGLSTSAFAQTRHWQGADYNGQNQIVSYGSNLQQQMPEVGSPALNSFRSEMTDSWRQTNVQTPTIYNYGTTEPQQPLYRLPSGPTANDYWNWNQ